MRHYLDGTLIQEPSGSAGVYFEKVRSRRFWGMLRNNIGRVRGIGELLFEEPLAIQILKAAKEKKGVDASVTYQMIDETGAVLIDSEINFANIRRRRDGWSVTLRDSGAVENLDLQADTMVSITPNQTLTLQTLALAQEKTHGITPALSRVAWKVNALEKSLAHYPAWEAETTRANATGDFATVTSVFQQQPVWQNTTGGERRLQVTARLTISHRSAVSTVGTVVLYVISGNEIISYPAASVVVTSALESKTYAINNVLSVPAGGELYIQLKDFDNESADFEFNYDTTASYLCVNQDAAIPDSTAKVISVINALTAIAQKVTPEITITHSVPELESDILTNGLQLRGVSSANLKASFGGIWDDIAKIYPMMLYKNGSNQLSIANRNDFLKGLGSGVIMRDVSYYEFIPNLDLLISRVRVGFNRWQSYTPTGREEIYGNEEYTTGLQKIDAVLDLIASDLCASEKLIEAVRRMQFNWGGSRIDKDEINDEQLFIKGASLLPQETLERWMNFWGVSSDTLTKTNGSPDTSERTQSEQSLYFTDEIARVEGMLTGAEWAALGDVLTFYDGGESWRMLVMSATFRPGAAGSGAQANTTVEGWVLKD